MKKFLLSDITLGAALTLLILGSYLFQAPFFETLEMRFYDMRARLRQMEKPGEEIIIITIDDDSISKIGRWPWPRSTIAALIDKLSGAGAKVIGLNIIFSEPERNQGLAELKNLEEKYALLLKNPAMAAAKKKNESFTAFAEELSSAQVRLDNDAKLIASVANAKNVALPMFFTLSSGLGAAPSAAPVFLSSHAFSRVANADDESAFLLTASEVTAPIEPLSLASMSLGHVNTDADLDGVIRGEPLVIGYHGKHYPSFAFQIARGYIGLPLETVKVNVGRGLSLPNAEIEAQESMKMLVSFYKPFETFPTLSAYDVLNDKIQSAVFKNKIVLVGLTAGGIATLNVTPVAGGVAGVELVAHVIANILKQNFLKRPPWAFMAEMGMILVLGLFMIFLLPKLKALTGSILTLLLFAAVAGAGTYLYVVNGLWVKLFYPSFLLIFGYLLITSKRFFLTEKRKELVEASQIETNKMLGLSFQGQGMLDLAFEKFRSCPLEDSLKDLLYNLALDFERKRQFNKAAAVYEHIQTAGKNYKDIVQRIDMLKKAASGAVFGAVGGKRADATVMMEGAAQAATLGRYEIAKELGRGAMGTVYLGKDPKINRMVAIKTLRFDEQVDEDQLKSVKERFFREAESAGKLSHPSIVKIYDAGDDQDVSYIAMELLDGHDLKKYCQKDSLLPTKTTVEYMIRVAEALDYAHAEGVVHRDIKPANIMLLKDGSLRVTDFGIARITASSKTATGTVMGTPSYMSPEQIAGKKVDGRADLFSLGVMLYELLTGEKPFQGDSIATLMFQITSDNPPPLSQHKPDIPASLQPVVDRALKKNPDERYQKGSEIAEELKKCLAQL